ncbi:SH3 domain-containing protein [Roseibium sp. TrichSKD4]|uniref:SH3 domain-containing protein n=1 Tax=Roseibium sp. TrichSKD4 TaxID=744980 RepID=UPI001AD8ABCF|nr:SH3 domain-containing protein [Roseibium sp. TrichSKD4]
MIEPAERAPSTNPVAASDIASGKGPFSTIARGLLTASLCVVIVGTGITLYLARPDKNTAASSSNGPVTQVIRTSADMGVPLSAQLAASTIEQPAPSDRFVDIFSVVANNTSYLEEQLKQEALAQLKQLQTTAALPQASSEVLAIQTALTTSSISEPDRPNTSLGYADDNKSTTPAQAALDAVAPKKAEPEAINQSAERTAKVTPAKEPVQTQPKATTSTAANGPSGRITSAVNMRRSAQNGSTVLAVVPTGANVTVNSCDKWWCSITFESKTGYVARRFVDRAG